jgi:hypothetical protein
MHGLPIRTLLDMFLFVADTHDTYCTCPECRVVQIIALCDLISPHEHHCIYVEYLNLEQKC